MKKINIAIDGPSGAGKSTTGKALAKKINYIYLDTGAIYRALTLYFLNNKIDTQDFQKITNSLDEIKIHFNSDGDIFLNDNKVSQDIRTEQVNKNVAIFAQISEVRNYVNDLSKKILEYKGVVLDGRDTGAVIAPDAELKIYLDADPLERAKRRAGDFGNENPEEVKRVLEEVISPKDTLDKETLRVAKENGVYVDTTNLSIDQQVDKIYVLAEEKMQ